MRLALQPKGVQTIREAEMVQTALRHAYLRECALKVVVPVIDGRQPVLER
jgi:hypothetical protein